MKKYYIRLAWYKDLYLTELAHVRKYYIKANEESEALNIALVRADKEGMDTTNNWVDEINIRHLNNPKRKHIKKRYNRYLKSM